MLGLGPFNFGLPRLADQLLNRRHSVPRLAHSCQMAHRLHENTKPACIPSLPGGRCGGILRGSGHQNGPDRDHSIL
ncbi:hypothetical protein roselon_01550 [Roseibacterium elongatum DSM 19469]|uniref:Uncharacterized protein n=1 Tax=Roseicyclus elongatus DSM 19469 TaxID=1294273 RepID=W8S1C2_9RHOB|nr:hypothetical protein roselon_01550 [Roseibacterium elongatum DSM 19469]